jgi:hypothetical protein
MRFEIAKLKKTLPKFLTVTEYCTLRQCCPASAYNDFRRVNGLAVKIGPNTFVVRDIALDELARAQELTPWVPQKDRLGVLANVTSKAPSSRQRDKQTVAARRKRDLEVLA